MIGAPVTSEFGLKQACATSIVVAPSPRCEGEMNAAIFRSFCASAGVCLTSLAFSGNGSVVLAPPQTYTVPSARG